MDFEATEEEDITLSRRIGSASLLFFTLSWISRTSREEIFSWSEE